VTFDFMSFTIPLARLSLGQRRTKLGCPLVTPECFGKNFRGQHIDPGGRDSYPPFRFRAGKRGTEVVRAGGGLRGVGGEMSLPTRSTSRLGAGKGSGAAPRAPWQTTGGGRLPLQGCPDRQEVEAVVNQGARLGMRDQESVPQGPAYNPKMSPAVLLKLCGGGLSTF